MSDSQKPDWTEVVGGGSAQENALPMLRSARNADKRAFIVFTGDQWWARGDSVAQAVRDCIESGARRTAKAYVTLIVGDDKPCVITGGRIEMEAGSLQIPILTGVRVGALARGGVL